MQDGLDDPERRRKAVRLCLWLTPLMFLFGYSFVYLTEYAPTQRLALFIGACNAALSLLFALVVAAFGKDWVAALRIIAIIVGALSLFIGAIMG